MTKEGIKGEEALSKHYQTICDIVDGDMSAEVLFSDF
jgi:transaldolase